MPITRTNPISAVSFLTELDRIEFSASGEESATLRITRTAPPDASGAEEIFSNAYYPDSAGRVTVYDLGKILYPLVDCDRISQNEFYVYAGGVNLVAGDGAVKVIRSRDDISTGAEQFAGAFFLTSMTGVRDTCAGRCECLTAFSSAAESVKVVAQYYTADNTVSTATFTLATSENTGTVDVSPHRFVRPSLGQLLAYEVQCGNRRARYRVMDTMPPADPAIIFRNQFGAWETVYLTGMKTHKPDYTRKSAYIGGRYVTYDIEEEVSWDALTGPLRPGMEALARDLARSMEVYLLNSDGTAGDQIEITDQSLEADNCDDTLPDFRFTYRRTSKRGVLVEAARQPHVFDSTFDATFE